MSSEIEDAQAIVQAEKQKRTESCSKDIEELLRRHNCSIDVAMTLRNGVAPSVTFTIIAL